jgi:hypothetical protein
MCTGYMQFMRTYRGIQIENNNYNKLYIHTRVHICTRYLPYIHKYTYANTYIYIYSCMYAHYIVTYTMHISLHAYIHTYLYMKPYRMYKVRLLIIGFIEHLQNVATRNYDSLTQLRTLKITVTTAHTKSPQSSPAVAWQRLTMANVPLPVGFRTVPGLSYQLLTSHNCNSQLTQRKPKLCYDRRSVGQSVLLSSTHLGRKTSFYYCQTVAG